MTDDLFPRPLRATQHCRHYSYENGLQGRGPLCALNLDLSAPGASGPCMPDPRGSCASRAEYTAEERATWQEWMDARLIRMAAAISVLPVPIPLRTTGTVQCPSCPGTITYSRWERGASVKCSTPMCNEARFNIAAGADWPAGLNRGA